jgi:hypothetical protein
MFDKNSPEHHAHPDSDDDDNIHIDANDALEVIDIDPTSEDIVENQLDDIDLAENMDEYEFVQVVKMIVVFYGV